MARKRETVRDKSAREAKESLAMLGSQIDTMEAALKGLKRAYTEVRNRLADRLRMEGQNDAPTI